jgi:uncharacterized protein
LAGYFRHPGGRPEFSFDDQAVWAGPAAAFGMDVTFSAPMAAAVRVWPHGRGATMAGRLTGEVTLPCARCTRPAVCPLDHQYEISESLDDEDATGESRLREQDGKIELDAGAILWNSSSSPCPAGPCARRTARACAPAAART